MSPKNILIVPLDWGLGHATRIVPIIKSILELNHTPILAASGLSGDWLKGEFPELKFIEFPNYQISYQKSGSMRVHFLKQLTKMMAFVKFEHQFLRSIIKELNIDAIISDNRYGVHHKDTPSVIISHQLRPSFGLMKPFGQAYLNKLLSQFNEIWVPDFKDNSLAGNLSKPSLKLKIPIHYIGPISRFVQSDNTSVPTIDCLAILSGPEPHRSHFEKKIFGQLKNIPGNHVIVRGSKDQEELESRIGINIKTMATSRELAALIHDAQCVISRSGYSSIMDYCAIGKPAILVATPGQPEQEYLSELHSKEDYFVTQNEANLNILEGINALKQKKRPKNGAASIDLKVFIQKFLEGNA